jgi:hypothetical protein
MAIDTAKYLKSRWLKAADLPPGRATSVTVKLADEHTFEQTRETKPYLDFNELTQSMSLNVTQLTAMIALFGDNSDLWIGQRINLKPVISSYQAKLTIEISEASAPMPTFNGRQVGSAATQPTMQPSDDTPF